MLVGLGQLAFEAPDAPIHHFLFRRCVMPLHPVTWLVLIGDGFRLSRLGSFAFISLSLGDRFESWVSFAPFLLGAVLPLPRLRPSTLLSVVGSLLLFQLGRLYVITGESQGYHRGIGVGLYWIYHMVIV